MHRNVGWFGGKSPFSHLTTANARAILHFDECLLSMPTISSGGNMESKRGVLGELILDQDKVTDELLKEHVAPYVGLSATEDKIAAKPEFLELPQPKRILLYLLARHAMVRLEIAGASGGAKTEKIAESCLIPQKSCTETLSRLKTVGMVTMDNGEWTIPVHSLLRVAGELGDKKERKAKRI